MYIRHFKEMANKINMNRIVLDQIITRTVYISIVQVKILTGHFC